MNGMMQVELEALGAEIAAAYAGLREAMYVAYQMGETAVAGKALLEAARAELLLTGRLDGKNEAQREAQARAALAAEYAEADEADARARLARYGLDAARVEVERTRALLRLAELTQSVAEG